MPGLFVLGLLRDFRTGDESPTVLFAAVFVVQTHIISYLVFVYFRWRRPKAEVLWSVYELRTCALVRRAGAVMIVGGV